MQATFYAFGLNHRTASVASNEAFALGEEAQQRVHAGFRAGAPSPDEEGPELVVLSTCNRTEAYLYGTEEDAQRVRALLSREAACPWPSPKETFTCSNEAAVQHVLEVAAGLRSLVPGDAQILAQMKEAYRRAVEVDAIGMVGHRLMHTAFRAAKRVQSETCLSSGAASVSTAAVALAEEFLQKRLSEGWTDRRALLVGAGKMGRLALEALVDRAGRATLASVEVTNRSPERAEEAARTGGAKVVPWHERHTAAARADLVIVATGADEPTLHAHALPEKGPADDDAATLVIDIARPRNADPAIATRPGYTLLDMDALQGWVDDVETARRDALPQAEAICEELKGDFVSWVFHQEALQPAIHAIRSTFETIRQQEIERYAHRFSEADAEELERLTQSILQKLLAVPIVRLKGAGADSIDFSRGIRLLRTLFSRPGCEEAALEGEPGGSKIVASRDEASAGELRPMEAPARCPFETHQPPADAYSDAEALRAALENPSLLPVESPSSAVPKRHRPASSEDARPS